MVKIVSLCVTPVFLTALLTSDNIYYVK